MWRCSECGKEFKKMNQDHYCGKLNTIDEYIAGQPAAVQLILHKVREAIRATAPDAVEKISWQMPTFWQGENIIHFAAFQKHIGIYPGDLSRAPFEERLTGYHRTKGAVQFPFDKPIDFELIADMARWRVACVQEKNKMNDKTYEYDAIIESTDKCGAYVVFPYDVRGEFGKGRVKVHATFDGEPYDGSVVNMGVKNPDGSVCYIIGIRKDIRAKIGKQIGDPVTVKITERK